MQSTFNRARVAALAPALCLLAPLGAQTAPAEDRALPARSAPA